MMMAFVVSASPTPVSFPPANDRTLELMAETHEIGTLVLLKKFYGKEISKETIRKLSLRRYHPDILSGDRTYVAFQRKP